MLSYNVELFVEEVFEQFVVKCHCKLAHTRYRDGVLSRRSQIKQAQKMYKLFDEELFSFLTSIEIHS